MKFTAASLADVAEHFRSRAAEQRKWAERARTKQQRREHELVAETLEDVASTLDETTIEPEPESPAKEPPADGGPVRRSAKP